MTTTEGTWSRERSLEASVEGWDIFWTGGDLGHPLYEIERIDDVELFEEESGLKLLTAWEDDTDAWVFVRDVPSDLHTAALEFLKVMSPDGYAEVMNWKVEA